MKWVKCVVCVWAKYYTKRPGRYYMYRSGTAVVDGSWGREVPDGKRGSEVGGKSSKS